VKLQADLKKMDIIVSVAKRDQDKAIAALAVTSKQVDKIATERDQAREDKLAAEEAKWFWVKVSVGVGLAAAGLLAWVTKGIWAKAAILFAGS